MKRSATVMLVLLLNGAYFSLFVIWQQRILGASQPVSAAGVKGVSTDSLLPSPLPTLPNYPHKKIDDTLIAAGQFALYNPDTGQFIASSSQNEPIPVASTTKLMTALLVARSNSLDEVMTISPAAAGQIPSRMELYSGEKISVKNALYGLLIVSGNDAAYALAEYLGGKKIGTEATSEIKVAAFVEEMNQLAAHYSLVNTRFKDPAGLDDEGHSSAQDIAKLISIVNQESVLQPILRTADITVTSSNGQYGHPLHNSNRLITEFNYPGSLGGKTGFTPDAGHCLVTSAKRGGVTLVAAVFHTHSSSNDASAIEARKLLDYGFNSLDQWESLK